MSAIERQLAHCHWPLFDLTVRTPRLELRYPGDDDVAALMDLAGEGVHPPGYMPFTYAWTRFEPPHLQRQGMQHFWKARAEVSPASFDLPLNVYEDGVLVGTQALIAKDFATTRFFVTGSWIGLRYQGKGIGKEMRAAVLHLGFAGLDARYAETGAFVDNRQSLGVTRALGYEENGWRVAVREGEAARQQFFVMMRERWEERRRDDITIDGLEPCLPLLGLVEDPAQA